MNRRSLFAWLTGGAAGAAVVGTNLTVLAMTPAVVHFMMRASAEDNHPGYYPNLIGRDWKFYLDGKLIDGEKPDDIGYVEGFDTRAGYMDTYAREPGTSNHPLTRHYGRVKAVLGPLPDKERVMWVLHQGGAAEVPRPDLLFPHGATFGS